MNTNLRDLPIGAKVFCQMRGRLYEGCVLSHSDFDQAVRIETLAAKHIRATWQSMSFRYSDGRALAQRIDGAVLVPETPEEVAECERRVRADAEAHARGVERRHKIAEPEPELHWWQRD